MAARPAFTALRCLTEPRSVMIPNAPPSYRNQTGTAWIRPFAPTVARIALRGWLRYASRSSGIISAAPPGWWQGNEAGDARQQHAQRWSVKDSKADAAVGFAPCR